MKAQYTPGPWETSNAHGDRILSGHRQVVADLQLTDIPDHYKVLEAEKLANARLIAAAPELLEALKSTVFAMESVVYITGQKNLIPHIEEAKAAIAKAEGK